MIEVINKFESKITKETYIFGSGGLVGLVSKPLNKLAELTFGSLLPEPQSLQVDTSIESEVDEAKLQEEAEYKGRRAALAIGTGLNSGTANKSHIRNILPKPIGY